MHGSLTMLTLGSPILTSHVFLLSLTFQGKDTCVKILAVPQLQNSSLTVLDWGTEHRGRGDSVPLLVLFVWDL